MKNMFSIYGNICGDRVRLGRAMHKPPLSQKALAMKLQFLGLDNITESMLSRIEKGERHVIDLELKLIAKALNVSIDWLVGDTEDPSRRE